MPTENVNKADNLIDVGEADQQSTEINLDNKGETEKIETHDEEKIEEEQKNWEKKTWLQQLKIGRSTTQSSSFFPTLLLATIFG